MDTDRPLNVIRLQKPFEEDKIQDLLERSDDSSIHYEPLQSKERIVVKPQPINTMKSHFGNKLVDNYELSHLDSNKLKPEEELIKPFTSFNSDDVQRNDTESYKDLFSTPRDSKSP